MIVIALSWQIINSTHPGSDKHSIALLFWQLTESGNSLEWLLVVSKGFHFSALGPRLVPSIDFVCSVLFYRLYVGAEIINHII